jgi:sulfite reductase beta subunit-like hemoprotein
VSEQRRNNLQDEILEYLTRHSSEPIQSKADGERGGACVARVGCKPRPAQARAIIQSPLGDGSA